MFLPDTSSAALTDDELVIIADELFQRLDDEESNDGVAGILAFLPFE